MNTASRTMNKIRALTQQTRILYKKGGNLSTHLPPAILSSYGAKKDGHLAKGDRRVGSLRLHSESITEAKPCNFNASPPPTSQCREPCRSHLYETN
jgi:hypothetical protein